MPKQSLTVGVTGCGRIARAIHLPALSRLPGARMTALAEKSPAAVGRARQRDRATRPYQQYPILLTDPKIEDTLARRKALCAVEFNYNFHPVYQEAWQRANHLGPRARAHVAFRSATLVRPAWKMERECARSERPARLSLTDGWRSLAVGLAGERSAS